MPSAQDLAAAIEPISRDGLRLSSDWCVWQFTPSVPACGSTLREPCYAIWTQFGHKGTSGAENVGK
jgi:hypothetical protein